MSEHTMTATEVVTALSQAGPILRAIPSLVKLVEYAASLEGAIAEHERALASMQRDVHLAHEAKAAHDAHDRDEHAARVATRTAELDALERKVMDLVSRRDTLAAEVEALERQHAEIVSSLENHRDALATAAAGLRTHATR